MPAPPMPSTPPPRRAAVMPAAPPSYASAIGAAKMPPQPPAGTAPTPTIAMSPPKPPGGSFAQRAAVGASSQSAPIAATPGNNAQVQTPEQLLSTFQSLTAGAEGSGVLCTGPTSGYALRPQNTVAWSQRLAPLVSLLQTTLKNVGPARFLAMLDRVANPYGTSIAAELGARLSKGARLDIVQDTNLLADLDNTPVVAANQGAHVRIVCTPVNQSVVGAIGHSNTASCVVVGTVKDRGVDQASGLLRFVPLALHLEPIANVSPPSGSPYIMLTFAWIGLRSAAPTPTPAPASAIVRRPGDWTCARCSAHNFASRSACHKCKRDKAAAADSEGVSVGLSPTESKASSEAGGPGAGSFRAGDWICKSCGAHCFASRTSCFKCEYHKMGDEDPPPPSEGTRGSGANPDNFRSGDWICSNCSSHNFASRVSCFRCTRPADKG